MTTKSATYLPTRIANLFLVCGKLFFFQIKKQRREQNIKIKKIKKKNLFMLSF